MVAYYICLYLNIVETLNACSMSQTTRPDRAPHIHTRWKAIARNTNRAPICYDIYTVVELRLLLLGNATDRDLAFYHATTLPLGIYTVLYLRLIHVR